MIKFNYAPDGIGEGTFKSRYFRDDMGGDEFLVYIFNSTYESYADKCIAHFNSLPENVLTVLCQHLIKTAKQDNRNPSFTLPELKKPEEILNYCWFKAMIVSIPGDATKASYIIEGEGDWGEAVGFVVTEDVLTYVGCDYLPKQ